LGVFGLNAHFVARAGLWWRMPMDPILHVIHFLFSGFIIHGFPLDFLRISHQIYHGVSKIFPFDVPWIFHGLIFHDFPMNYKLFPWWLPEPLLA